ncbi:hypothetical protein L1049_007849 [Liquidambar formosana]|uniref:DNA-directed RNA polymerase subunit n=1 Tax=Liquidambar formosana TaxID=63359 RepID=A0AAP0X470_LIQFO
MATTEGVTESVEAVRFGFLTDEEVRKHSFVKVTNPILLDSVEKPVPGGLYDPAMGPIDERTSCKSCGQRSFHCPGHCGHIDLIVPVYNPLLFDMLYNVLQRTCFNCKYFRAERTEVETCVSQLKLILEGDIIKAKSLDSIFLSEHLNPEDGDESHVSSPIVPSGAQYHKSELLKEKKWTSLQLTEAMSVLNKFLKERHKECRNIQKGEKCGFKNPTISKPTFGWFHTSMSDGRAKANVIGQSKGKGPFMGGAQENTSSEVENANDMITWENGFDTAEINSSIAASQGVQGTATERHKRKSGQEADEFLKQKEIFSGPLLPSEVRNILKELWETEVELCSFICDIQCFPFSESKNKEGYSMFFLERVLVPPIKFRPPSKGGDSVMEHPQTVLLGKVLQSNISLGNAHVNNSEHSKIVRQWIDLQQSINVLFDSKSAMGQGQRGIASGICQLLEKKEGIFRQKMMGKRVNFACRSVISPDPYLAVNEIGVPPYFALRLTYPERVTPWNVGKLRGAIINGSDIHPGATHYVDKLSTVKLPPSKKMRISVSRKLPSSRGVVTQPGKSCDYEFEGKFVFRHLQDGDIVLVNRQPTLHKPSIMAHVVRVLKGEKTLRMHYANCSTYNADFDGDEMNVHFPQDEISRAEAYNIVNANNQYIVPTRGDPIRALIQDHIISAVLLTKKDTFLSRDEYNQLLYSAGVSAMGMGSFFSKPDHKVYAVNSEDEMQPLLPAILKPEPLWTGKQVITAVLNHITRGHLPFTVKKEGKIPCEYFGSKTDEDKLSEGKTNDEDKLRQEKEIDEDKTSNGKKTDVYKMRGRIDLGEETLFVFKNYLVSGVIDKAQFGTYGLVHTVHELYGPSTAGILLSALSRLFTAFLQIHGFTCGVDDLLILNHRDIERKRELEKCENIGEQVHCDFIGSECGDIDPMKLQMEIERAIRTYGEPAITFLDGKMRQALNEVTSKVNKDLFLKGLLKPFLVNCFSLMTTTGAKGGMVNFQQVSSLLGQQELEGKRVPRMVSGKTLPCFPPWDCASRAGGFISDNFLNGLRPQEYYFHCMAGREGLVDTAVKTSRSGYLQRCLIKNLECLKVCYDHTVRDADGSIIQFIYGEDGVDVHRTGFIAKFDALKDNHQILHEKFHHKLDKSNRYIKMLPSNLREKAKKFVQSIPKKERNINFEDFLKLMKYNYFSSLAQPGEPVGVIAAQSIGEPSTQMTLNTFHLAGRGEMNVTLGIPRLQEILMTGSKDIKTPIMTCPLQKGRSKDDAKRLAAKLNAVTVADIIESMEVCVVPFAVQNHEISSIYKLKMKLYKPELYPPDTGISLEDTEETLKSVFVRELEDAIQNHVMMLSRINGIKNFIPDSRPKASNETDEDASDNRSRRGEENDDDDDDGDDDAGAEDFGLDAQKRKQQATDEMDYEDGSEDEDEPEEGDPLVEFEKEIDQSEDVDESSQDGETGVCDSKDEDSKMLSGLETLSKAKSSVKKTKSVTKKKKGVIPELVKKESDRAIFVAAKGLHFEVHFRFTNESHILLAQIAQKTAKKVYIKTSGKIDRCQRIDCSKNQVIYYGEDPKKRVEINSGEKENIPALQTAGVDFGAFWQMQDDLDVRYIYSNNIHAMLNTYGVEAARETIMKEVQHVFKSYGITVDIRHLTLIADFMTHSGGYRPMNRSGGIAESISPFSKMSFETASKFIVDAASHGQTDYLETPSARICLGLPVKMGTGCFDLMQRVEI